MGFLEKLQNLFGKKKDKAAIEESRRKFLKERQKKLGIREPKPVPAAKKKKKAKPKSKTRSKKEKELVAKEQELKKSEKAIRKKIARVRKLEKELDQQEELSQSLEKIKDPELEELMPITDYTMIKRETNLKQREGELQNAAYELEKKVMEIEKREKEMLAQERQLPEEYGKPLYGLVFDNFIVGPNNKFAHDAAYEVAKAPADAYNPLFLYSNVGLGKTHLLNAIGNYILKKNKNAKVAFIPSEKFINDMINAVETNTLEEFRNRYRALDVLMIDDIQFIGDKRSTQEEFFHTFNALHNSQKQIVITSDRPPKELVTLEERLRSRFEGGLIVDIKPLSLGTRTLILKNIAKDNGILIPDEVITTIAKHVKTNVRALKGALNKVIASSSLADRKLDIKLVEEILTDIVPEKISIDEILD